MLRTLLSRLVQWAVVLSLPIILFVADLRIVTGHWFVRWEYQKTGFPADSFGLSTTDRIRMADVCIDWLATNADISLLANLQLPEGEHAFNERELRHMDDVQIVYNRMTTAGIIAALVLVGGIIVLYTGRRTRRRAPAALVSGGLLALVLLGAVGTYIVLSWGEFFTTFHRIFFEGESWIFPYSDTLIRLFPMRFWMDVAAVVIGLFIVEALIVAAVGWRWSKSLAKD